MLRPSNQSYDQQEWYCKVKDFMKIRKKSVSEKTVSRLASKGMAAEKSAPRSASKGVASEKEASQPTSKEESKKKGKKSATTSAIPADSSPALDQLDKSRQDLIKMLKVSYYVLDRKYPNKKGHKISLGSSINVINTFEGEEGVMWYDDGL